MASKQTAELHRRSSDAAMAQQVEHVLGKDATCLKKDFRKIIKNTLKKGYAVMAQ